MPCRMTNTYELYWINDDGEVDATARPISASNDDDALIQAAELADGDRVELWTGSRLVARLGPATSPATRH